MNTDKNATQIDAELVIKLLQSVADMRVELERIESKVDISQKQKAQLARDIRCLSDNVHAFREKFEPYLITAVEGRQKRDRAYWQVATSVAGWGIIAIIGTIGVSVWWYVVHLIRDK